MSEPEARARPQYGEYATPEEQRARIKRPDVTGKIEHVENSDAGAFASPKVRAPAAAPVPRRRFADRIATVALLAYGFINVIGSVPSMVDYENYMDTVLSMMKVSAELADPAGARSWGIAAAFVLALGWLITALFSWLSLARRRLTWWIPLVGGIFFTAVSVILLVIPMAGDPALMQSIVDSTR